MENGPSTDADPAVPGPALACARAAWSGAMLRTRENGAGGQLRGRRSQHWRKDGAILARLEEVERLHLAGKSNRAIARELRIDEWTVRRDLQRLQELWEERVGQRVVELRAQCVAQLVLPHQRM